MAQKWIELAVRIPFRTGIPRDVAINVMHFMGDTATADYAALLGAVVGFYNAEEGDDRTQPIAAYMSSFCDRDTAHCSIRGGLADPNTLPLLWGEVESEPWTLGPIADANPLPNEVAAVSSLFGDNQAVGTDPKLPIRSRRGRIYVGPLNFDVMQVGPLGRCVMSDNFITDLVSATKALVAQAADNGTPMVVLSRKTGHASLVTNGFVNDEFDTQRRRGFAETRRVTWSDV